ncbi:hypothetical protein X737_39120 [Mesorhizobium sp. L48C026A00]|nr:hypothetical protein X737_39120 [Mesorhizobium sp. L48C026A00]
MSRTAIAPYVIGKMPAEAIEPKPDRLPADNDPALRKQVFHVGGAEGEPVIGRHRIRDNFPRKTKALEARMLVGSAIRWT